jgi:hypothetical protein
MQAGSKNRDNFVFRSFFAFSDRLPAGEAFLIDSGQIIRKIKWIGVVIK